MRKNEIGKEELSLFVCAATSASDFHNFFLAPSVILLLCGKIHKKKFASLCWWHFYGFHINAQMEIARIFHHSHSLSGCRLNNIIDQRFLNFRFFALISLEFNIVWWLFAAVYFVLLMSLCPQDTYIQFLEFIFKEEKSWR